MRFVLTGLLFYIFADNYELAEDSYGGEAD